VDEKLTALQDRLVDGSRHVRSTLRLLKRGILNPDSRTADGHEDHASSLVDVPDFLLLAFLRIHPPCEPVPELVVEDASDEAPLVQERNPLESTFNLLKVQVLSPIDELWFIQLGHVEVGAFYFRLICPSLCSFGLCAREDLKVKVVNPGPDLTFNLKLAAFHFDLLLASLHGWRRIGENLLSELSQSVLGKKFCQRPSLRQRSKAVEIAGILVHWNVNHPLQDGEDFIFAFETLLKLNVFVPEGVRQEVEANGIGSTFEKSMRTRSQHSSQPEGGDCRENRAGEEWKERANTGRLAFNDKLPTLNLGVLCVSTVEAKEGATSLGRRCETT